MSARYREALSLHFTEVQVETMSDFTGVKDTFLWDFTCHPRSGFVGAMGNNVSLVTPLALPFSTQSGW